MSQCQMWALKKLVNMIKEGSDEEVDNFHNYNETFKNIDALARKVLELNLYQYSNTSN